MIICCSMNINHSTQVVIRAPRCGDSHSFSQQYLLSIYSGLHFLLRTGGHREEDGPPSINTYLTVPTHWIPDGLGWETFLLPWFHGMTETVFQQAKPWLDGKCFLLSNSGILLNHPVCISSFCSLLMPEGRHFLTVKDQEFSISCNA